MKKEPIDIELTKQKAGPEKMKMLLTLYNHVHEVEQDIALANFNENYKSKLMRKNFQKSNWMII